MKIFSIIIPVYNGYEVIGKALDSIYSQDMPFEQFEVICVDDCSPTMETFNAINKYTYNGKHPKNLKIIRHEVNKRQGGARNTALQYAEGKWILYIDQDDCFCDSSICKLVDALQKNDVCDIVMFDYCLLNSTNNRSVIINNIYANKGFLLEVTSGLHFIQKYPIPWTPWCYAYKKDFLKNNNIRFEEYVRFEDVDYVIKATLKAKNITFVPIQVYQHWDSGSNTSFVGNNKHLIEDLFKISIRIKNVSEDFMIVDMDASQIAMKHHIYHYHWLLKSLLWRLPYNDIIELLKKYVPYKLKCSKLTKFANRHPQCYAVTAQIARPILLLAIWIRNKTRK